MDIKNFVYISMSINRVFVEKRFINLGIVLRLLVDLLFFIGNL